MDEFQPGFFSFNVLADALHRFVLRKLHDHQSPFVVGETLHRHCLCTLCFNLDSLHFTLKLIHLLSLFCEHHDNTLSTIFEGVKVRRGFNLTSMGFENGLICISQNTETRAMLNHDSSQLQCYLVNVSFVVEYSSSGGLEVSSSALQVLLLFVWTSVSKARSQARAAKVLVPISSGILVHFT